MKHSTLPPNPFCFGWRDVLQIGPDGSKYWTQAPLTAEEALHPQEGDHIAENRQQGRDRRYLAALLEWRLSGNPQGLLLSDCLINWGVPHLGNHSPDISVFDGVTDPKDRNWGTFRVVEEGARCVLVMEIVSADDHDRRVRDNDVVHKVREYYRAGVPLYFIVDQEREGGPRSLIGYRHGARKFVRIRPNRQGRLLMEPVRLLLGLRDDKVVCWDADSGEEMVNFMAMAQAREAEAQARQVAEAAREVEAQARRIAEAQREAAEAQREAEAQARQAAEVALAEAQARIRALEEAQQRRKGGRQ